MRTKGLISVTLSSTSLVNVSAYHWFSVFYVVHRRSFPKQLFSLVVLLLLIVVITLLVTVDISATDA